MRQNNLTLAFPCDWSLQGQDTQVCFWTSIVSGSCFLPLCNLIHELAQAVSVSLLLSLSASVPATPSLITNLIRGTVIFHVITLLASWLHTYPLMSRHIFLTHSLGRPLKGIKLPVLIWDVKELGWGWAPDFITILSQELTWVPQGISLSLLSMWFHSARDIP